jgi:hypothetical protein
VTALRIQHDLWRIPTYVLWLVCLVAALFPERVYYGLRSAAWVTTQGALVNSHYVVPLGFAAFFAFFAYHVIRQVQPQSHTAASVAVQMGLIAFLACLPVELQSVADYTRIPVALYRRLAYLLVTVKIASWLYLFALITRYYWTRGAVVFVNAERYTLAAILDRKTHWRREPKDKAAHQGSLSERDSAVGIHEAGVGIVETGEKPDKC